MKMEIAKLILEYIKVLIWPIFIILIITWFKNDIVNLIKRAKKIELPGGISFEGYDREIQEAKQIANKVKSKKPKTTKQITKTMDGRIINVNEKLKELGLRTTPSGLSINYYDKIAEDDPSLALARIRIDLDIMLENISRGFNIPINKKDSVFRTTKNLRDRNAITEDQYHLMQKLLRITTAAVHGEDVTKDQAKEVFIILDVLIRDFVSWLDWGFLNK